MKKILITGGAGYIGSHTAIALTNAGYDPIIVDDFSNSEKSTLRGLKKILGKDVKCHEGNCNDRDFMDQVFQENDFEGVIHFAAYKAVGESTQKPLKYYANNIGSLVTLMETMERFKVKNLVFSSSCTVYPMYYPYSNPPHGRKPKVPMGIPKKYARISCGIISRVRQRPK
jgi:UDP-glucose 4-epimerase